MKIINSNSTKYLSEKLHYNCRPKYKICLAQIEIEDTFAKSIEKIKEIIKIASNNNCQLVIFPEDALFGVIRNNEVQDTLLEIEEVKMLFNDLSLKFSIEILMPTVPVHSGHKIYNSSFFISPNSMNNNMYKKINLWLTERSDYASGELQDIQVTKSSIGNIGQSICWDLQDAIIYKQYKTLGADIVVNQAFWYKHRTKKLKQKFGETKYLWPHTDYQMVDSLNLARSNENGLIAIFVNSAGEYINQSENEVYKPIGLSQVVFPGVGVVAKAPRNKECLLIIDLPEYSNILADYRLMYGL